MYVRMQGPSCIPKKGSPKNILIIHISLLSASNRLQLLAFRHACLHLLFNCLLFVLPLGMLKQLSHYNLPTKCMFSFAFAVRPPLAWPLHL